MIPPDVASSLRLVLPDQQAATNAQTQAVASAQKVADVLSNLVPGQRILAEIQALLPNGSYRAIVGQRDITLALPFSAKAGDTLELEVTESDGKLTLAFVTNRSDSATAKPAQESVATSLSSAGKLIGNLMGGIDGEGKHASPAPLNSNRPLVETMPKSAADLAPMLKQALTQSGMFYEAHQARWVAGELPTEVLKQEPQGKFPVAQGNVLVNNQHTANAQTEESQIRRQNPEFQGKFPVSQGTATVNNENVATPLTSAQVSKFQTQEEQGNRLAAQSIATAHDANSAKTTGATKPEQTANVTTNTPATFSRPEASGASPIPRDLTPLVQQQLDGLANQNFAWQGQVWPGQQMRWEIGEDGDGARSAGDDPAQRWLTRLKLSLPMLGNIDVALKLRAAGNISIVVTADSDASEARLRDNAEQLRQQLDAAGLNLTELLVQRGEATE